MHPITFEQAVIFVDLDNTLIRSDLTLDPLLRLIRRNPVIIFLLPFWLLRGRAFFKQKLSQVENVDVESLPYDQDLISLLKEQKGQGKRLVLATASHQSYAEKTADHLGIFDDVIASDANTNTKGSRKLQAMQKYAGDQAFAYIGDSHADVKIWQEIGQAYLIRPAWGVESRLSRKQVPYEQISGGPDIQNCLRVMRPWQWLKNLLVFVPLILAKMIGDGESFSNALIAFFAFCLFASAGYVLNDMLDLDADRLHPRKQDRPFVSGQLPLWHGVWMLITFLFLGTLLALSVNVLLWLSLLLYFVLVTAYSLEWKQHAILDILLLAGFYSSRLISGAVAADVTLSFWLMAFAIFLFLSLAAVKRCTELRTVDYKGQSQVPGRGYTKEDEPLLFSMGIASGYVSVVVIALYINSEEVKSLYSAPQILWLVCPIMLYWLSRMWLKTSRHQMHDDPILFAMRDKVSLACAVLLALLMMLASTY